MPKLLRAAVSCFIIGGLAFVANGFLDAFAGHLASSAASFLSALADAGFCWSVWVFGRLVKGDTTAGDGSYRYSYQFIDAEGKPIEREEEREHA